MSSPGRSVVRRREYALIGLCGYCGQPLDGPGQLCVRCTTRRKAQRQAKADEVRRIRAAARMSESVLDALYREVRQLTLRVRSDFTEAQMRDVAAIVATLLRRRRQQAERVG
jgi:hypothetical protein